MTEFRCARIVNGSVAEIRKFGRMPDPNPAKGIDWRLCPEATRPAFDPATEVLTAPAYQIGETVTETIGKRAKTAEEIDAGKEGRISAYDNLSFDVNFDQENRLRVLEGRASVTRAQYRAALKARL